MLDALDELAHIHDARTPLGKFFVAFRELYATAISPSLDDLDDPIVVVDDKATNSSNA